MVEFLWDASALVKGDVSLGAYQTAVTALRTEALRDPDFRLLTIEDADLLGGIPLLEQYHVNSADAAILVTFLRYADAQLPGSPTAVLVASDIYLLRAAAAGGLPTLNPEGVATADVAALLATL